MLYRSELKKLMLTQRGLLLLIVCLLLKSVFLFAVPEMKDSRIQLSQKQYDKYLLQLHGEATTEKSAWILAEYNGCMQTIACREEMERRNKAGELTDAEWDAFLKALDLSYLHENAAKIFAEKAEQFSVQPDVLPPAHYIYEYGWQTIFTLEQFPDIFLLFGVILISAQCFSFEAQSGMMPVLLSCKNGRKKLLNAKFLSLSTVVAVATFLSVSLEAAIFWTRGWCDDLSAPLYSVKILAGCYLPLSLEAGYLLTLAVRSFATVLFAALIFALSVWIKNTLNLVFLGLCLLIFPLLWNTPLSLLIPGGLLSGTNFLLYAAQSQFSMGLPIGIQIVYTTIIMLASGKKHSKGL